MKKDITVIIGPTGIGKSDYAITLAQKTNAEIISADAFQVYKDMDIGTGKVSKTEQKLVQHHLIDILNPNQPYDVTQFCSQTLSIIQTLRDKKKPSIICGGTGLYIHAFLYDYSFPTIGEDPLIRHHYETLLASHNPEWLWSKLYEIDPDTAEKIPQQNTRRVIRALEIFEKTGKKPSIIQTKKETSRPDVTLIGLRAPRNLVIQRINKRIDKMFEKGLIDEVKTLLTLYPETTKAFEALGYKETIAYLNNAYSKDHLIELIKIKTRQFAKRQMTWFNRLPDVTWVEIES